MSTPSVSDDEDSDDVQDYVAPDPVDIKAKGAEEFAAGRFESALSLWRQALALALKGCVCSPSASLHDMTFSLRLNVALVLLKLQRWSEAITNAEVVLGQRPKDPKALYRVAAGHRGLGEYDRALEVLDQIIAEVPDDSQMKRLREIVHMEKVQSDREIRKGIRTAFWGSLNNEKLLSNRKDDDDDDDIGTSIRWIGDTSDDILSNVWDTIHSSDATIDRQRALCLSLPLTIADIFNTTLTGMRRQRSWDVPMIKETTSPLDIPADARRRLCRALKRSRFTLHIVGVRGDVEMEASWTALLQRLPTTVKILQVVFIGFNDGTDKWSPKLTPRLLSPPMMKNLDGDDKRKMVARLYRGLYQEFAEDNPEALVSPSDPLHPDVIVFPEPAFEAHLKSWTPAMAAIFRGTEQHAPLVIYAGHSVAEFPSHEALSIPLVASALGQHAVVPLEWNPYSVRLAPPPGIPPMPIWQGDSNEAIQYSGVSGKYMVAGAFCEGSVDACSDPQLLSDGLQRNGAHV